MKKSHALKLVFALFLVTLAGAFGVPTPAAAGPCGDLQACEAIYAPVICSNGVIYNNRCYADADCATGCKPYNWA
jgi:hypothetical protein